MKSATARLQGHPDHQFLEGWCTAEAWEHWSARVLCDLLDVLQEHAKLAGGWQPAQ
jgi:hypothetical protein